MSKFYYSGIIKQENYLTKQDILFRYIFGSYKIMLIEASSLILYGIYASISNFLYLDEYLPFTIDYFNLRVLGAVLIFLALICYLTNLSLKNKTGPNLLNKSAIVFLVIGLFFIIFPLGTYNFIYRLIAISFIGVGLFTILRKGIKTSKKIIPFILLLIGLFVIFSPSSLNIYRDFVFDILIILLGSIQLYYAIKFRKSYKKYDDEVKGFTDFKIE